VGKIKSLKTNEFYFTQGRYKNNNINLRLRGHNVECERQTLNSALVIQFSSLYTAPYSCLKPCSTPCIRNERLVKTYPQAYILGLPATNAFDVLTTWYFVFELTPTSTQLLQDEFRSTSLLILISSRIWLHASQPAVAPSSHNTKGASL